MRSHLSSALYRAGYVEGSLQMKLLLLSLLRRGKQESQEREWTCPGSHRSGYTAMPRVSAWSPSPLQGEGRGQTSAQRGNLLESVAWANPWVFHVCLPHQARPSSDSSISSTAPRASFLLTGGDRSSTQPRGVPKAGGTLRGGGTLGPDITEWRSWSRCRQASWGPSSAQMSQECAALGTTSVLPAPPPAPRPLICPLKLCLCPTPCLPSFISPRDSLASTAPLAPCLSPAPPSGL